MYSGAPRFEVFAANAELLYTGVMKAIIHDRTNSHINKPRGQGMIKRQHSRKVFTFLALFKTQE